MSCIHLNAPQGSDEWFAGRCGAITASMFAEVRKVVGGLNDQQKQFAALVQSGMDRKEAATEAGYKAIPSAKGIEAAIKGEKVGDFSDAAKAYAFKLAVERISNELLDDPQFDTWQARRGRELEPEARLAYEERKGVLVEQTGLALTEDRRFGASVDGLVDDDGSIEIKCFLSPAKLSSILLDGDISDCVDQMQGGLFITGRRWCDFTLYCPALRCINKHLTIIRVERDDDYINAMIDDLVAFDRLVEDFKARLIA